MSRLGECGLGVGARARVEMNLFISLVGSCTMQLGKVDLQKQRKSEIMIKV